MPGSQLEDAAHFRAEAGSSCPAGAYGRLRASRPANELLQLRRRHAHLGAYNLGFGFDYAGFAEGRCCARSAPGAPPYRATPTRLSSASSAATPAPTTARISSLWSLHYQGRATRGQPPWYLVDGSLMVALPDILIVAWGS